MLCVYAPNISGSLQQNRHMHCLIILSLQYVVSCICTVCYIRTTGLNPVICVYKGEVVVYVSKAKGDLPSTWGIFLSVLPYTGTNSVISSSWANRILYPKYICSTVFSCSAETKMCRHSSGYNSVPITLNLHTSRPPGGAPNYGTARLSSHASTKPALTALGLSVAEYCSTEGYYALHLPFSRGQTVTLLSYLLQWRSWLPIDDVSINFNKMEAGNGPAK